MRFFAGQRVKIISSTSARVYYGHIVRALRDDYYLVDDGTGQFPRPLPAKRLQQTQVREPIQLGETK